MREEEPETDLLSFVVQEVDWGGEQTKTRAGGRWKLSLGGDLCVCGTQRHHVCKNPFLLGRG